MEIRRIQPADTQQVVELWQAAELTVPWNDPLEDIATYVASDQDLFFVAIADEHEPAPPTASVVGTAMAGFDGHRGWIYYLAVAGNQRGTGIGRALVERCELELTARGCPKINLMVRDTNTAALDFYRALGYDHSAVATLGKRLDGR